MANFMFVYYKEGADDTKLPTDEVMAAWGKWFEELGSKLVDGGGPFNDNGMAVENSGVSKIENHPSVGYSIVKASDIKAATELAKGCPMLKHNKTAAVRVYEVMPM